MLNEDYTQPFKVKINPENPYRCPKCGKRLVLKEGRYGRFMACPAYPDCEYTRALWTFSKPYCEKCKGEELLPFIKDGKVISHAFVYCECRKELEPYYPLTPEDFDFPCSYDYRAYYEKTLWGRDLPPLEPHIEETIPEPQYVMGLPTLRYYKPKHLYWKQVTLWSAIYDLQEHLKLIRRDLNTLLDKKKRDTYSIK